MAGIRGEYLYNIEGEIIGATGSLLASMKNKANNPNFYKEIALKAQESWAANGRKPRGFEHDPDLARRAGAVGGKISRRTKREN